MPGPQSVVLRDGCCGIISLRTCVLITAYVVLALDLGAFVLFIGLFTSDTCVTETDKVARACIVLEWEMVCLIGCPLIAITVGLMLVGIYRNLRWLMMPYIILGLMGIGFEGYLTLMISEFTRNHPSQVSVIIFYLATAFAYGFAIYVHLHVISLFRVLKGGKKCESPLDSHELQELHPDRCAVVVGLTTPNGSLLPA